jgi:flagellar protein FliS
MTPAVPSAALTNSTSASSLAGRAASGHEATWTLIDSALERISAARAWGDPVAAHRVEPAVRIIVELRAALDLHRGGPIAANVDELYDYMCRRLGCAGLPNGIAAMEEVSHLLHALRSAWAFLPAEVRAASGS